MAVWSGEGQPQYNEIKKYIHFDGIELTHWLDPVCNLVKEINNKIKRDTFTFEVPVVIRLTCDCAVADDAVMPIHAESSS